MFLQGHIAWVDVQRGKTNDLQASNKLLEKEANISMERLWEVITIRSVLGNLKNFKAI